MRKPERETPNVDMSFILGKGCDVTPCDVIIFHQHLCDDKGLTGVVGNVVITLTLVAS